MNVLVIDEERVSVERHHTGMRHARIVLPVTTSRARARSR